MTQEQLDPLLTALAELYESEPRDGARQATAALRGAIGKTPTRPRTRYRTTLPPERIAACLTPSPMPIMQIIPNILHQLDWYCFGMDDGRITPDIAAQMVTAEIVGPDGAFHNPNIRAGLFMQEPNLHYTTRTHAAEETFIMLAGMGRWGRGWDDSPTDCTAGDMIFHPSMTPHSTRTLREPLIAAWRWSGDITIGGYRLAALDPLAKSR